MLGFFLLANHFAFFFHFESSSFQYHWWVTFGGIFFFSLFVEPPSFIEKPQSQDVIPAARVQLKTLVSGTPPLQIKWIKDSKELLSGASRSVYKDDTSSVLELFSAKLSDSGNYICQISNDVGSTTCKATLFVKGLHFLSPVVINCIFT